MLRNSLRKNVSNKVTGLRLRIFRICVYALPRFGFSEMRNQQRKCFRSSASNLKTRTVGIPCGESKISTLLFADDVVILSENEQDLQKLLNILSEWCSTWGIQQKSKCMHFRSKRKPCSSSNFKMGDFSVEYCHEYKYLGFWINEFL